LLYHQNNNNNSCRSRFSVHLETVYLVEIENFFVKSTINKTKSELKLYSEIHE